VKRAIAVFFVLVLTVPTLGVAAGQAANDTAQNATTQTESAGGVEWSPPGPFQRGELTTGGVQDPKAPESVRPIGDPVTGNIGIRAAPASPLQNEKEFAPGGETLESDRIQMYGTAYGEAVGEYELVVVYWSDESRRVNGTNVNYAADQSVQRIAFNMSAGYNQIPVKLQSHYDQKVQATMWLERGGERVDGARWRYQHRSNPLTSAPPFNIDSEGDLLRAIGLFVLLPGIPGMFIGGKAASHFLERTITSPRKGISWWLIVLGVLGLVLLVGATWQVSALLSRALFIIGLGIALLSFVVTLRARDMDVETAEFNKKELRGVTSVSGDESKQAREEVIQLREIVRRDGKIYMPAKGIRPFIARYWAEPANIDDSDITTDNAVTGDVSKKYEVDPTAGEMMQYKPARLSFSPTLIREREADQPDPLGDGEASQEYTIDQIFSALSRINWSFVGPAIVGGTLVYFGMQAWLSIPSVSAIVALLPAIISGYEARDGDLSFEPAPYHFSEARAVLAHERAQYREARTFEDLHKMIADMDLEVLERSQNTVEAVRNALQQDVNEMFSINGNGKLGDESADKRPEAAEVSDD